MELTQKLDTENYKKGFLVDEELMGGVAESPEQPGNFVAYVMRHTTGEYLGAQLYPSLAEALAAINSVERTWQFEKSSGCGGGGGCGEGKGGCSGGGGCGGKGHEHGHDHDHDHEHEHGHEHDHHGGEKSCDDCSGDENCCEGKGHPEGA